VASPLINNTYYILLVLFRNVNLKFLIITLFLILSLPEIFSQDSARKDTSAVNDTVTFAAVGDIMPGTSFPDESYLPPGDDPVPLMASLFNVLTKPDITFGNLEGPFSDKAKLQKKCRDTTTCYAFRVPERYAGVLDMAGFDLLSIANNHIGDFGYEAMITTSLILDSYGISYAGTKQYPWSIKMVNDSVSVGFCAFSPNRGTINLHDDYKVAEIISMLERNCDIVVVSVHGGGEGADHQHVTRKEEFYYGENRGNLYEFAHRAVDLGADLVLGHGPHVSRAVELYKGRLIAYSLGNFLTYRRFNLTGPNGFSPVLYASLNHDGEFLGGKIIPVYQNYSGHVKQDPQKRAIFKIRELMLTDFPETNLVIDSNGNISLKH